MIIIEPRQTWTTADGNDTITILRSEDSRWIITTTNQERQSMTASHIRSHYRIAEPDALEE